MSFQVPGAGTPTDAVCRYGSSKLVFRGPKRRLDEPYIAFLGGNETYGRFVEQPFASLLEPLLQQRCVNLGCPNGGLDTVLKDADILRIARGATRVVLQVPGAHGQTNLYYRVHPRRNDRFVQATTALRRLYPDVDFTQFNFVRHLLMTLAAWDADRFQVIEQELTRQWLNRMTAFVQQLNGNVVLLWLRVQPKTAETLFDTKPFLVSRDMVNAMSSRVVGVGEINLSPAIEDGDLDDMQFGDLQQPIAERMIGPGAHRAIAGSMARVLNLQ